MTITCNTIQYNTTQYNLQYKQQMYVTMFAYLRKFSLSKAWEAFKMGDKQQVKEIKTIILATCYTWEKI